MQNQFGYNCPVNWAEVDTKYNFVTIQNCGTLFQLNIGITAHEKHPYPLVDYDNEGFNIGWHSEGDMFWLNYIQGEKIIAFLNSIDPTSELLNEECYGKCIWQRPKP